MAIVLVAAETLLIYPLKTITRAPSLAMVYLLGVVMVSMVWGLTLGFATSLASVLAYDFFHVPPILGLAVADTRDWVMLAVFAGVATVTGALADLSRLRAEQAQESDLTADMAALLLSTDDVAAALPAAARRIAHALDVPGVAIKLEAIPGIGQHSVFPLRDGATSLGTLQVPANLPEASLRRLQERVVPSLESLLRAGRERAAILDSLRRDELRLLANQQAALRRVATLVARGASPAEVFATVTAEVSQVLGAGYTTLLRYEPDATVTIVSSNQPTLTSLGHRPWPAGNGNIAGLVRRTGRATWIDNDEDAASPGARKGEPDIRAKIGLPIVVEDRLWGAVVVSPRRIEPLPPDAEERIKDFTDLAATAIANADNRAELIASRARIVAAADEARRRIERDLHDGAQQQLISIGLELHAAAGCTTLEQVKAQLSDVAADLQSALENLREMSRGIHPTILTTGGLEPALKSLARRSAVPVELDVHLDQRLSSSVEVAAYYVVSESLTNAAKHAHASLVQIVARLQGETLQLSIRDNGVGGADPDKGSGLTGLIDRMVALGGHMTITSPAGGGTSLSAAIPTLHPDPYHPPAPVKR
ncbi:sensor histidine kinase [Dactylosporangium darangshiense]|uniref:sensor histidine kinase n=1 Tax=Dactylosporangium darangshiense TaxID=579108 RepID=UPI0031E9508E